MQACSKRKRTRGAAGSPSLAGDDFLFGESPCQNLAVRINHILRPCSFIVRTARNHKATFWLRGSQRWQSEHLRNRRSFLSGRTLMRLQCSFAHYRRVNDICFFVFFCHVLRITSLQIARHSSFSPQIRDRAS